VEKHQDKNGKVPQAGKLSKGKAPKRSEKEIPNVNRAKRERKETKTPWNLIAEKPSALRTVC